MSKQILAAAVASALMFGAAHAGPFAKTPFSGASSTYVEPERKSIVMIALDLLGWSAIIAAAPQETPDMTTAKPVTEECEQETSSVDGETTAEEEGVSKPTKAGPEPLYLAF
jgi:hypothetical protein